MPGFRIAPPPRRSKPIVLAIIVFAALQALATTEPSAPGGDSSQQLSTLVQRFTKAQEAFDTAALKELTAENYVEVSPAGEVDPRARMLEFYAPDKKVESPDSSVTDVDIRTFGDVAVIVAKIGFEMQGPDNKSRKVEMRGTFVAQNTSNRWKLVSAQYTGIHPPKSSS